MKQFNRGLKSVSRQLSGIKTLIGGAFAVAGINRIVTFGKSIVDAGDKLTKLRDSLGESTKFLQFLEFAAERSGSTLDAMATGMQRAKRRMSEFATSGRGELAPIMREMSDELQNAVKSGKSFEQILPLLARDIGGLATSGDKLRVAMKFFDSEGARPFLNFLGEGVPGVNALEKEFNALGITIKEDDLDAMADFNDVLTDIGLQFRTAMIPLLREVLPLLTDLSSAVQKANKDWGAFLGFVAQAQRTRAIKKKEGGASALDIADFFPEQKPKKKPKPKPKSDSAFGPQLPMPDSFGDPGAIAPTGIPTPEETKRLTEAATLPIKEGFNETWANIGLGLDFFVETSMESLGTWAEQIRGTFFDIFQSFTQGVADAVANAIVFGEDLGKSLENLMKNIAAFIISQLIKMVIQKLILDRIADVSSRATAAGQIAANAGVAFSGTLGWWASVFAPVAPAMAAIAGAQALGGGLAFLAEGGVVNRATLAVIGEAGPEAVVPLSGNNMFGGNGEVSTTIILDGEVLATSVVSHMGGVLTLEGVGI